VQRAQNYLNNGETIKLAATTHVQVRKNMSQIIE